MTLITPRISHNRIHRALLSALCARLCLYMSMIGRSGDGPIIIMIHMHRQSHNVKPPNPIGTPEARDLSKTSRPIRPSLH